MIGPTRGLQYLNEDQEYKRQMQEGGRQLRQNETDGYLRRQRQMQEEKQRNALRASNLALVQNQNLSQDSSNPRTVTDDSMQISNGGSAMRSASGSSGSGSGRIVPSGGFGTSIPQIDGRYMSLVAAPNPSLDSSTQPNVTMPDADFSPGDAKAYQDAAFANLKAKSGAMGKSAIDSLIAQLAGRGITSSGTTGRGIAQEIIRANDPLNDLNVEHLGQEYEAAGRARELSENRAQAIYSGNLSQRAQNISSQTALNNLKAQLALAQYQGEIGQNTNQLEAILRMI
jgi:hypothetical protein